jgi:hypothetical protein
MAQGFLKEGRRRSEANSPDKPDYVEQTLLVILVAAAVIALAGFAIVAFRFW